MNTTRIAIPFFMPRLATETTTGTFCTHGFRPEFCPYCTGRPKRPLRPNVVLDFPA